MEAPPREEIAACSDVVVSYGRGATVRRALDGISLGLFNDEDLALHRTVRLGQDDAAPRPRWPGRTHRRCRRVARQPALAARQRGPRRSACARDRVRLPGGQPAALLHRLRERRVRVAACRTKGRRPASRSSYSSSWASPRRRTTSRRSSRAARRSVSRSRGRSRRVPSCCSATSRPAISTRTRATAYSI